jgi:hypothetical protein
LLTGDRLDPAVTDSTTIFFDHVQQSSNIFRPLKVPNSNKYDSREKLLYQRIEKRVTLSMDWQKTLYLFSSK